MNSVPSRLLTDVGQTIASVRRSRGWTQLEFADKLGVAVRNLQRLESGRQNMTLETLERVAQALSTTPRALMSNPQEPPLPWVAAAGAVAPPERVPVVDLQHAAGLMRDRERVDVAGWTLVHDVGRHPFVARVDGAAMEPLIPAGAWCLFRAAPGDLSGAPVLLIEHHDVDAVDSTFVVRKVTLGVTDDGRPALRLLGLAKGAPVLVLPFDPATTRVVAAFDRVLGTPPRRRR